MIRVNQAPEPRDFHAKVRQPGLLALAEMTGQTPSHPRAAGRAFKQRKLKVKQADGTKIEIPITDPAELPSLEYPDYWTRVIDALKEAYDHICAYSCFRIHKVTGAASVDHMAPKSRTWNRVYEWDNYRLCSSRLNARKKDFTDVLDPFEVEDDWFELELVGFQVIPGKQINDPQLRANVDQTITRLGLNDFRKDREEDAEAYWNRDISFGRLVRESPFVARELRRQGRLLEGDG